MSLDDRTRAAVRTELQRLFDRYGEIAVERETVVYEPALFEQGRTLAEEGWLGDAGVWVEDADGRVLLMRHEETPETWGTPGDSHEPASDAGLDETARRALERQTGVTATLSELYYVRWQTIVDERDDGERLHMLSVEFEGEALTTEIGGEDPTVLAAAWFANPPERLHEIPRRKAEDG